MENVDYDALDLGWKIFLTSMNALVLLYTWITNKQKVNAEEISSIKKECNALDDRLIRAEEQIKSMPNHEDIEKLHARINEAAQMLTRMDGKQEEMNHTLRLMHDFMMNKGNGK